MNKYSLLIIAIIAFIINEGVTLYAPHKVDADMIPNFQESFTSQQHNITDYLNRLSAELDNSTEQPQVTLTNFEQSKYEIYLYQNHELSAWRNTELSELSFNEIYNKNLVFHTDHGYYLKDHLSHLSQDSTSQYDIFALFKLKSEYPFDNDYMENRWNPSFDINPQSELILDAESDSSYIAIYDINNNYAFSIKPHEANTISNINALSIIKIVCISIWLISIFLFIFVSVIDIRLRWGSLISFIANILFSILTYIWALQIHLPTILEGTTLFSSQVFAYNWWIPSIGYFTLIVALLFLLTILTVRYFRLHHLRREVGILTNPSYMFGLLSIVALVVFILINDLINLMVHHSSQLLLYVNDIDISLSSGIKLFIITLLWLCYLLLLDGVYAPMAKTINRRSFTIIIGIISLCITIPIDIFSCDYGHLLTLGFISTNGILCYLKKQKKHGIHFSRYVWFIFASALFLSLRLLFLNIEKEQQNSRLLIDNLTFELMREDDPVAEHLLAEIEPDIHNDPKIQELMLSSSKNSNKEEELYKYIRNTYFDGYLTRYDIQIIPCHGEESTIQLTQNGLVYNCYQYFKDMVETFGVRINKRSDFYCLNDNDGRASYFGIITIPNPDTESEERLFIEFNSRTINEDGGYLDLLTNKRDHINTSQLKGYSYAKYYEGRLSNYYGSYKYPHIFRRPPSLPDTTTSYTFTLNGYKHLVERLQDNQYVALSFPQMSIKTFVANYSFLFIYMLLISTIILYILRRYTNIIYVNMSIHERMQNILILLSLTIFIFFCALSIYLSFERDEQKMYDQMSASLDGISYVISTHLQDPNISLNRESSPQEFDNFLKRIATQYQTDVHVYDAEGRLFSTSRRELLLHKIQSNLMDDRALSKMKYDVTEEVFQQDRIGTMYYYSIYSTIFNDNGDKIGYINIPFFEDQKTRRKEMITTLLPMVNLYMLIIIISILGSYFLANTFSKPLRRIRNSLSNVALEKRNEKLDYPHNDEIGLLVEEYNRMIDELERSAQKLAATERESTWRNMARQIAHEIKNPLTPMKLNVQYLLKAWNEGREDFDKFIQRISKTLVEQIDQLSYVATQFSSLAKTPNGQAELVNIVEKLDNCICLFQRESDVSISLSKNVECAYSLINPDQLLSVFNNLIKNAQQAKKDNQEVININASIGIEQNNILIEISDNGKGIPQEIQHNIFKPNFTTKSTGMGLGLAIVNKIILDAQGSITFNSTPGTGTSFYIRLPLKEPNRK
ncbi:MAG: ATP-binding protein [Bacteroidia bacterium]|nr:ATP-binding protein [Bacteroidia bacterium]